MYRHLEDKVLRSKRLDNNKFKMLTVRKAFERVKILPGADLSSIDCKAPSPLQVTLLVYFLLAVCAPFMTIRTRRVVVRYQACQYAWCPP